MNLQHFINYFKDFMMLAYNSLNDTAKRSKKNKTYLKYLIQVSTIPQY